MQILSSASRVMLDEKQKMKADGTLLLILFRTIEVEALTVLRQITTSL